MGISTHVLDATNGRPVAGMTVELYRHESGGWSMLGTQTTDNEGRVPEIATDADRGVYRLVFDTDGYFQVSTFYPEVLITFRVEDPSAHYHVPLLLSPFAYSTYRGS
jgi:5-hydroxyisourate hydrolase